MIKWFKRTSNGGGKRLGGGKDVCISKNPKKKNYAIRFYDMTSFGDAEKLKVGIDEDKLYFAPAREDESGWALRESTYVKKIELSKSEIKEFVGSYDLLFDKECSLYYIEKHHIDWVE